MPKNLSCNFATDNSSGQQLLEPFAVIVYKEFTFDSAHFLPHVPPGHKCRNMHGHTYRLRVILDGPLDPKLGWVYDFADIKKAFQPIKAQVDHQLLNDIEGLENPTAENIVIWIWNQLRPALPMLKRLELSETPSSGVIYEG